MNKLLHSEKINWMSILVLAGLVVLGVASRTVFHLGPNFELITAILVLSAVKLSRPANVLVPVLVIGISDMLIGNTAIIIFTWSGFLAAWLLGLLSKPKLAGKPGSNLIKVTGMGILGVLFFYFWTNFGVVVTTNMYPHTLAGYGESLVMALPFLKNQLVSAILMTPALFAVYELVTGKLEKVDLNFARK